MRAYRYIGGARIAAWGAQLAGLGVLVIALLLAIGLPILALGTNASMSTLGCLSIWILLIGIWVGSGLINSYPTVWIGEDYLQISVFLIGRATIAWADVIDVGEGRTPWGFVLVRTRRITVFHRLYGWQYSRTLRPSFLIGPQIQDFTELVREIGRRSRLAKSP
jgi:hypothetical protein